MIIYQEGKLSPVDYSIVFPVHNQEQIIYQNLLALIENTTGKYELIIILDSCKDNTKSEVFRAIKEADIIERVTVVESLTPLFQTSADNMGFKMSRGKYVIDVDADMQIKTYGYNYILSKPCRLWNDVFAVSGRCTHNFNAPEQGVGKIGFKACEPLSIPYTDMDKFYSYESVCRGPLLMRNDYLQELEYMDEQNFHLDGDDHDLMARASMKGWICGYMPIEYYSDITWGSTRKPRDEENQRVFDERTARSNGGFLKQFYCERTPREPIVRDIPLFIPKS